MRFILLLLVFPVFIINAEDRCPNYPYETLFGSWYGEQYDEKNDHLQKWTTTRNKNGTYKIEFNLTTTDETKTFIEEGLWSYSRCLYTTIIEKVDGKNVQYQEVYLVNEINDSYMDYTNYRTKSNWRLFKVN